MMHGHLRLSVLNILAQGPHAGYDLMKYLQKEVGVKPSPGSIYPLLQHMHAEGLVSVRQAGKRKQYTLTQAGKTALQQFRKNKEKILDNLRGSMKLYDSVAGCNMKDVIVLLERMRAGKIPFGPLTGELLQLRTLSLKATEKEIPHKQREKILKLLRQTNVLLRECINHE